MCIDWANKRRILVVKLSSLGDVVHVTPVLRALRRAAPRAKIHLAVERAFAAVVRNNPNLDGLIEVDGGVRGWLARALDIRRAMARHVAPRFDVALDFQGRWRSAAWVYLSGAQVCAGRGGVRPGWQRVVRPDLSRHAIEVCADIADALGLPVSDLEPEVCSSLKAEAELDAILDAAGLPTEGFLVISPFSRWRSKDWLPERFAELLPRLASVRGLTTVLAGGPDRERDARRLLTRGPNVRVSSLVGRLTLDQAICLYRRARLMVSGDSGPMHVAAALGTPVIALFGPTLPERTGPWGRGCRVIQARRPSHHHAYLTDRDREHMAAIDVDTVHRVVMESLFEPTPVLRAA